MYWRRNPNRKIDIISTQRTHRAQLFALKDFVGWVERRMAGPNLARIKAKPNIISQILGFGAACYPQKIFLNPTTYENNVSQT